MAIQPRADEHAAHGLIFSGLSSRTGELGYNTAGSSSSAKWNSSSADVSATIHISDRLRLVDAFRFRNFSVAGDYLDYENSFFPAAPTTASLLRRRWRLSREIS